MSRSTVPAHRQAITVAGNQNHSENRSHITHTSMSRTGAVEVQRIENKAKTIKPKKISQALEDKSWVGAIKEELLIEAGIRIFLAFASYMWFIVYQMDVKSAFLYSTIDEEVYVSQPPGFIDPKFPKNVYKVVKALYGLHQAPRAWYATLSAFLEKSGYRRGTIEQDIFIRRQEDIMLVPDGFSMRELTFFLGLQVKQKEIIFHKVHTLTLEDGTEIHMLAERKYPLIKETLERMLSLKLLAESSKANGSGKDFSNPLMADSLPKNYMVINKPCCCNEALAIPEQTATSKETSNPFMTGSLPKTTRPT
ncbi:putative ribonuclease H-like domain-containing protein [Tanacetum coccineum]